MNSEGGPEMQGVGPSPKDSIMTKQLEVATIVASLWAWIAFAISGVSLLFHIIAFAIPEWAKSTFVPAMKKGLWIECGDAYGCFIRKVSALSDAERCTQAFAFFALVLMFVAGFLIVFYIYAAHQEDKAFYGLVLVAVHGATAFCLMIAFAVWAGEILNKSNGLFIAGGSFGLEIVCFIFEIAAAVLMFLDWNFSAR